MFVEVKYSSVILATRMPLSYTLQFAVQTFLTLASHEAVGLDLRIARYNIDISWKITAIETKWIFNSRDFYKNIYETLFLLNKIC